MGCGLGEIALRICRCFVKRCGTSHDACGTTRRRTKRSKERSTFKSCISVRNLLPWLRNWFGPGHGRSSRRDQGVELFTSLRDDEGRADLQHQPREFFGDCDLVQLASVYWGSRFSECTGTMYFRCAVSPPTRVQLRHTCNAVSFRDFSADRIFDCDSRLDHQLTRSWRNPATNH